MWVLLFRVWVYGFFLFLSPRPSEIIWCVLCFSAKGEISGVFAVTTIVKCCMLDQAAVSDMCMLGGGSDQGETICKPRERTCEHPINMYINLNTAWGYFFFVACAPRGPKGLKQT